MTADLELQTASVEATGSRLTRLDDHLRRTLHAADGRRLAPQILDQTNGITERFDQQVMAGQSPGWRALAGLKWLEQHASRRLLLAPLAGDVKAGTRPPWRAWVRDGEEGADQNGPHACRRVTFAWSCSVELVAA